MTTTDRLILLHQELDLVALDVLDHASAHLSAQYSDALAPGAARAHFEARALLVSAANEILAGHGKAFLTGAGVIGGAR